MEAVLYVPSKFNDGSDVSKQTLTEIWSEALERFGGFSRSRTPSVEGGWKSPTGQVFIDHNYTLSLVIDADKTDEVEDFARWLADLLKQEAIFVAFRDSDVRFIEGNEA